MLKSKIAIYNLEPKYQNYALDKVRLFYQRKGATVEDYLALAYNSYDEIWCSSIFDWTNHDNLPPNIIKGGTGFDLTTNLPDEIENIEPHLNYGFTTRGCIRKCPFCVVPQKEGKVRVVGDLMSLWDGKSKDVVLYDNNILALPQQFEIVCKQALEHKIKLDFNQGIDFRLLTPELSELLKRISHVEYHLALDDIKSISKAQKAIDMLKKAGINRSNWYVLVGYNSTPQEDLIRLNFLRNNGQGAYVQRYKGNTDALFYTAIARWANQHHIFQGMTWQQFLEHKDNRRYLKLKTEYSILS